MFNLQANFIRGGLLISVMCHHLVFDEYWLCFTVDTLFRWKTMEPLHLTSEPIFHIPAIEAELEHAVQNAGTTSFHVLIYTLCMLTQLQRYR